LKLPSPLFHTARLALPALDIIEAILNGRQPVDITQALLMQPFAVVLGERRAEFATK